ncbi:MAG: hypothetical protein JXL67_10140 [Calditrichaeota bacterium]|nr:hypothetical protein [Calditrichota bacterium]
MNLFSWFRKKEEEKEKKIEELKCKNEDIRQLDHLIDDLFNLDDRQFAEKKEAV